MRTIFAFRYALEHILGDVAADERVARIQQNLKGIRDGFKNGTIDASVLEIAKQLTKNRRKIVANASINYIYGDHCAIQPY